jgi:hypothetical protein
MWKTSHGDQKLAGAFGCKAGTQEPAKKMGASPKWHAEAERGFRESDMNGGWGYVIRDENGDVIQSGSGRVLFAISPMHMELIACIQGVTAAISLGIIWRPMHSRWCGRYREMTSDLLCWAD